MIPQIKDKFYDEFLKDPNKDSFSEFIKNNCGELDEVDFKATWIEKGQLAKTLLAMANSGGGIIVVGVSQNEDGTFVPVGLETIKDSAIVNDEVSKYIDPGLDYEILNFSYDSANYSVVEGKKFQLVVVHDTPERLPFISMNATTGLEKDVIYIRRGTKCEKANAIEIDNIIQKKIATIFKSTSDLSLDNHLEQLKTLYNELPQKIKVLVRKGEPSAVNLVLQSFSMRMRQVIYGEGDEYEEQDNPNYPEESYEAFILRMIKLKKLKIEKVLDLK